MAKNTKERLANSLKKLLAEKTLDKITVKEITDDCGLNRQTFYYNFQDVYALLDWIFQNEASALHVGDLTRPWIDSFTSAASYLYHNKAMILNIYHSIGRVQLEQYLRAELIPVLEVRIAQEVQDRLPPCERTFVSTLYASGFLGILFVWLDNAMNSKLQMPVEQFAALMDSSIHATLQELLKNE